MDKEIHFTKIAVDKNPERLPRKDGEYFVCRSGFRTVLNFKKGRSEMMWLKEVRWYINPDD